MKAFVGLAENVLHGNLDIFECDVGSSTTPDTLAVHSPGADTFTALDQEQTDAAHSWATRPHRSGEVVAPDAVGDPLLFTIYYSITVSGCTNSR